MTSPQPQIPHYEHIASLAAKYPAIACDVWGVVHDGETPYRSAVAALMRYRQGGGRVLLLTNAPRPAATVIAQLEEIGVSPKAYDGVVTSGDVTRELLKGYRGKPVYHIGPYSRDRAVLDGLGLDLTGPEDAKAIICTGLFDDTVETPEDYEHSLALLSARNLPMICANPDLVVDRGGIRIYCAGALAKLYEEAGGRVIYAGKPHAPVYDLTLKQFSTLLGRPAGASDILAIGDGLGTDIKGAIAANWDTLFIADGIHAEETRNADVLARLFEGFPERPVGWQRQLVW